MAMNIPYELISHQRKLGSLYKRWIRNIEAFYNFRHPFRFEAVVARADFDKILHEKDMIKAKQMMEIKEEQLFQTMNSQPIYFPTSPLGVAYRRYQDPADAIIDYWHPYEKAMFPQYFAKRELRKQQYIEMWERHYGVCKPNKENQPSNEEDKK